MISDEILVQKIRNGDEAAFEALVSRYHGPIHSYVVRMGCDFHRAQDLVQDVFLKVFRNLDTYETQRLFRPWIYTIASNTFKDYLKKAYVRHDSVLFDEAESIPDYEPELEDLVAAQEDKQIVEQALDFLAPMHREVLVLRYYQELKLSEIAQMMNIPQGTVKSRLSTALHRVRDLLAKEAIFHDAAIR
ncbi:MAG: RNA polymerase sigma factor [Sporomusaceae bacterium]|nr:RNA polymerase sigma factor [Sporomusaceae bacterium]